MKPVLSRRIAALASFLACTFFIVACDGAFRFDQSPVQGADGGLTDAGPDGSDSGAAFRACQMDTDCVLATLFCDLLSGTCVECVEDADCEKPSPRCDGALHRCVACGVDQDCPQSPNAQQCDPTTHECVPQCDATSFLCPVPTPLCVNDNNTCVQCINDVDCKAYGEKKECDLLSGKCSECNRDAECPAERPHCDRLHDVCVECATCTDCPIEKPLCDPSLYACVPAVH